MTPIEKTQAVADLLAAGLPALLAGFSPSLSDFESYQNYSPEDDNKRIVAVYIDEDDDNTDSEMFSIIIQAQLASRDQVQEYHSVIMPFLREFLISSVVGMTERKHIKGNPWPMDSNGSSFIYYFVQFESSLDDCSY